MLSKALRAADLAWPFKVPLSPVMLVAFSAVLQILVDDLEGPGIGVVDADLLGRQRVLDDLDLDALVGQRARDIEPKRFEVARQHFHGGDAARLDGRDKIRPVGEGEVRAAPKAQALRVGEIVHRRGARRGDVDDAGLGERVLQAQPGAALLRGGLVAAFAFLARGVRQGVRLVEQDHAVEIVPEPVEELLEARGFAFAFGGSQRRVGREQDALS